MLSWASRFNICVFLDGQGYQPPADRWGNLLAAGVVDSVCASAGDALEKLRSLMSRHDDWMFGHFGYGLVEETEPGCVGGDRAGAGQAGRPDEWRGRQTERLEELGTRQTERPENPIGFPDLHFFVPEVVIELKEDSIRIGSRGEEPAAILGAILGMEVEYAASGQAIVFEPVLSREKYIRAVEALRQHILRGDAYEINFCQEFFSRDVSIDPLRTWVALSQASPNPFSAYYRMGDSYMFCASPERYLRREGHTLLSQPIKGTAARVPDNAREDEAAGIRLGASAKDRSENVMVVDLVRNDLSKICLPGTVRVSELFGVHGFPHVFQMISTIEGELAPGMGLIEAIEASFPMGSMTGAPKRRVVELIHRYEPSSRGLFSGSVGYVAPGGDFDFNVVIRSLFYNRENRYLSYQVGSGITFYSEAGAEYEECLVKAAGIKKALAGFFP